MNRIDRTFASLKERGKKAFVAYVAAGDPDYDRSLEILKGLADAGADILELGLPFSDPLADGIVNQMAAERALRAGMTTRRVLDLIRDFRKTHDTPLVLFTYLNPIFAYGFEDFQRDAVDAGADGILLLDLPPDEAEQSQQFAGNHALLRIRLIAPNTPTERAAMLAAKAEGFIYALSRTGVTGAHGAPSADIGKLVQSLQQHATVPVCVGFGISNAEQARSVAGLADGVIVGSALVKQVELHAHDSHPVHAVVAFAKDLIAAVRSV
jgi:tryptophan synthase alpha chain